MRLTVRDFTMLTSVPRRDSIYQIAIKKKRWMTPHYRSRTTLS